MTNFKCRTDRTSQFALLHSHFAAVGDPKRIALVAADLVAHFEKRVEAMDGKAMIVIEGWKPIWQAGSPPHYLPTTRLQ